MEYSDDFYELRRKMRRWDDQNAFDYAREQAFEQGVLRSGTQ